MEGVFDGCVNTHGYIGTKFLFENEGECSVKLLTDPPSLSQNARGDGQRVGAHRFTS